MTDERQAVVRLRQEIFESLPQLEQHTETLHQLLGQYRSALESPAIEAITVSSHLFDTMLQVKTGVEQLDQKLLELKLLEQRVATQPDAPGRAE